MKRSTAIKYLVVTAIMWLGSIPWLLYLAVSKQVSWSVPMICAPIYVFLFYGAYKTFWPHVRRVGSEEQKPI